MFLKCEEERFRCESKLSHWLPPHVLVTPDIELVEDGGQKEGDTVLHHLVAHAMSLAERKWLEVAGFLEAMFSQESARIIQFRILPIFFIEIHVVIVNPDHGVSLNFVPCNISIAEIF